MLNKRKEPSHLPPREVANCHSKKVPRRALAHKVPRVKIDEVRQMWESCDGSVTLQKPRALSLPSAALYEDETGD